MATGDFIGNSICSCGGMTSVKEGKNGSLTGYCGSCGHQAFWKTPKAVAAMRAHLGGTPASSSAPAPAAGKKSGGLLDGL